MIAPEIMKPARHLHGHVLVALLGVAEYILDDPAALNAANDK